MRGKEQKKLHIRELLLQCSRDPMYGAIVWTIVPIVIQTGYNMFLVGEEKYLLYQFMIGAAAGCLSGSV